MAYRRLLTESEFDVRVALLKAHYAYQFRCPNAGYYLEPGWLELISRLCEAVDKALAPDARAHFHWTQIKEKFGTLRAYWDGGPTAIDIFGPGGRMRLDLALSSACEIDEEIADRIQILVHDAEAESARTCLFCGAHGERRADQGWIVTACGRCARSRKRFADEKSR